MLKHKIGGFVIEWSDANNYTVSRLGVVAEGENKGKETSTVLGYYNSIESACMNVMKRCADQKETLGLWLNEYRKVEAEFKELLEVELNN